ncbi:von Willebrand factor D and EGF domain-containing protein-like isoform X2 [Nematostella vectensis]|uniref:von Willebrand factor D and EGF domain-containing protein-like isoform X2 n=1 Tax=Nematostella vectensis TaxID=45351 RepID=UPI002077189F|nr:von Willebrand factor D and EGF domain-containing protein-like isoform X2 [Nematostella vectensis]
MGRFAACILVLYAFTGFTGTSDGRSCPRPAGPCSAANYIPIKDPHRSTKYRYKRPQPALCDYLLQLGWYRFTSSVGGEIPTTKPEPNMCGTFAPIWMRGTHPDTIGVTKETTACVNVNNRNNGCFRSIDMCVEMCSGGYYVYYLRPPYGCSMAYCAAEVKAVFPSSLVPKPKVEPLTTGDRDLFMVCNFTFPLWSNVSFNIEWYDGPTLSSNMTSCRNKGENCVYDPLQSRIRPKLGSTTSCRLRMKYNTHLGNKWTRQKYSDPYYIGIEVHPRHILTKECDKPFDITLRTTVPIHILPHPLLPIKIFATLLTTNNVGIFDNCQVAFSHGDDVGTTYNVRVRSVCDTLIDGQSRVVHILFKGPSDSLPSLIWDDYILPRVRVTVKQTENRECRTYNDPHFSTFDGKYHPFLPHGDYVLFQDNDHHTEVHTRLWTCWDSSASCNCGVAIRERNDVMILSICNSQLQHQANTPMPMTFRVPSGHLPNGTHIYRQISGSRVTHTVLLPSGTKVEVIRLDW